MDLSHASSFVPIEFCGIVFVKIFIVFKQGEKSGEKCLLELLYLVVKGVYHVPTLRLSKFQFATPCKGKSNTSI